MAKKSKVEKRLSKPEKVTNEELNKIQTLVDTINRSKMSLGGMELEKHRVLHNIAGLEDQIRLFREDLKKLFPKKSWNKLHLQIIYYGREYCKARECYGLTCKICTTCYPNRKSPIKTRKA